MEKVENRYLFLHEYQPSCTAYEVEVNVSEAYYEHLRNSALCGLPTIIFRSLSDHLLWKGIYKFLLGIFCPSIPPSKILCILVLNFLWFLYKKEFSWCSRNSVQFRVDITLSTYLARIRPKSLWGFNRLVPQLYQNKPNKLWIWNKRA